ncbi:MAG: helix-turn-helix transcriptional regulator [Tyzzerella sp.]|nr:helix-turn-helix transcriptional regulator [Tyzzerella sp.]
MIISERIFKILRENNMSQNTFAQKVGLASSTISDWKTKKTNPSADKLMDICTVLDVTPEQLLTGKGIDDDCIEGESEKIQKGIKLSKEDICILKDIHGMKEAQRKRLMKYIDALKQLESLEKFK